jgi:hypothetical protein
MVQSRAAPLHQKLLLKRPWYSDNITQTTGITTTFNKEKNILHVIKIRIKSSSFVHVVQPP